LDHREADTSTITAYDFAYDKSSRLTSFTSSVDGETLYTYDRTLRPGLVTLGENLYHSRGSLYFLGEGE
jgi:hypothetical protein